jgi:ribonuclease HII
MNFPLGTNKLVEKVAKKFIKNYGKEKLNMVAKISFKTTKKII